MEDDKSTQPAENESAVEENSQDTSPVDEQTTSEQSQGTEGNAEETQIDESATEETEEDSTERKPTRAERRIRQQSEKIRELEAANQRNRQLQAPPQLNPNENGEVTPDQLNQYVAQEASRIAGQTVEQALAQERAKANFERDIDTLPNQFPELDDNSENYNPALEEAITQEFQEKAYRVTGFNPQTGEAMYALDPSVRLADIAKRYTDVARSAAKQSNTQMRNSVARTADDSAIKPSTQTRQDKPVGDMSIAEMEEKLGFAQM